MVTSTIHYPIGSYFDYDGADNIDNTLPDKDPSTGLLTLKSGSHKLRTTAHKFGMMKGGDIDLLRDANVAVFKCGIEWFKILDVPFFHT